MLKGLGNDSKRSVISKYCSYGQRNHRQMCFLLILRKQQALEGAGLEAELHKGRVQLLPSKNKLQTNQRNTSK